MEYSHVRLKDPEGVFFDSATGFTLARSQVVPWPDRPGKRTEEAKRAGVLIPCHEDGSTEQPPPRPPDPEVVSSEIEEAQIPAVEAEPQLPLVAPGPEPARETEAEPEGGSLDSLIEKLKRKHTAKELRDRCEALGLSFTTKDSKTALATMLVVHEGEGE